VPVCTTFNFLANLLSVECLCHSDTGRTKLASRTESGSVTCPNIANIKSAYLTVDIDDGDLPHMETGAAGSFSYEAGGTTLCGDPDDVDGGSRSTKSIYGSILSGASHEDGAHSLLRRAQESFGSWFDTPWDVGSKRALVEVPTMVDDGRVDLVRVEARIRNLVRELRGPETQTRKISETKAETVTTVTTAWRATRTPIQQHKLQRAWLAPSKAGPRGIFPQQHPVPCLRNYSVQKNAQAEVSDLGEPSAVATDGLIWQQGAPLPKPHETSSITDRYSIFPHHLEVYPRDEEPTMVKARLSPAILGSSLDLDSLQQQYVPAAFTRAVRESIEEACNTFRAKYGSGDHGLRPQPVAGFPLGFSALLADSCNGGEGLADQMHGVVSTVAIQWGI
jgi:hypothetical protein